MGAGDECLLGGHLALQFSNHPLALYARYSGGRQGPAGETARSNRGRRRPRLRARLRFALRLRLRLVVAREGSTSIFPVCVGSDVGLLSNGTEPLTRIGVEEMTTL